MQIESQSNLRKSRSRRASILNQSNKENYVSKKRQPQFEQISKQAKKIKPNPAESSNFLSKLTKDVQALKEIQPAKIQSKTGRGFGAPYNTTIDYGNFKQLPGKQMASAGAARSQEKKVHQVSPDKKEKPPAGARPRKSLSAPRSPANYQKHRLNYIERKETGNLQTWEIKKENYIQNIWKQSEPVGKLLKTISKSTKKKNGSLKMLDFSKSTLNASKAENIQEDRLKIAKRQGLINFSFDNNHVQNLDQSVYFDDCKGIKEKIEFQQKVQKLKNIVDDSRLDDSRKYLIKGETPEFGAKSEEEEDSAPVSDVKSKVTEFLNLQLKEQFLK